MTQQEYISLVNQANKASYDYYVLSAPSMTDAAFDSLLYRIEQCEQEHTEWTLPDSPTQKVGSDLSNNGRRTTVHRSPMLSCQKAKSHDAVFSWLNNTIRKVGHDRFKVSIEYKYDGISCSLVYQDGQLISASTRGNGLQGQDITAHAGLISGIPQHLPILDGMELGRIEVCGEIVCPKENLHKTSQRYSDCRTAASALCNMDVPASDCSLLSFIPWKVDAPCFQANGFHYETMMFAIHSLGFDAQFPVCFDAFNADGITEYLSLLDDRTNRASLPYPIDGLVLKVDDKELASSLGATAHHPHGNIAYKFAPETAITTCTRIEVTEGKTGRRTPVAYFNPVTIMGREVSRASLYSEASADRLGIVEGSTIEVALSNDVIPTVLRVIGDTINETINETINNTINNNVEEEKDVEEVVPLYIIPNLVPQEAEQQCLNTEEDAVLVPSISENLEEDEEEENAQQNNGIISNIALYALSVIAMVLLFPVALALTSFGIPVINGAFTNS